MASVTTSMREACHFDTGCEQGQGAASVGSTPAYVHVQRCTTLLLSAFRFTRGKRDSVAPLFTFRTAGVQASISWPPYSKSVCVRRGVSSSLLALSPVFCHSCSMKRRRPVLYVTLEIIVVSYPDNQYHSKVLQALSSTLLTVNCSEGLGTRLHLPSPQ